MQSARTDFAPISCRTEPLRQHLVPTRSQSPLRLPHRPSGVGAPLDDGLPVGVRLGLPAGVPRVAIEAGVTDGWWKYGCAAVVGIDTYGESAPAPVLFEHFGFTPRNVADTVLKVLQG